MKTLILEDQEYQADLLIQYLHQCKECDFEILGIASDLVQASNFLKQNKDLEIVFADIELKDGHSLKLFTDPSISVSAPVVFLTSFPDYSIDAFNTNCIHYIVKPITKWKIAEALSKLETFKSMFNQQLVKEVIQPDTPTKRLRKPKAVFKVGNKNIIIDQQAIAYLFVKDQMAFLYQTNGNKCIVNHTLDEAMQLLDPELFFRVNRQIVVSINAINRYYSTSRGRIKLDLNPPQKEVEAIISFNNRKEFLEWV